MVVIGAILFASQPVERSGVGHNEVSMERLQCAAA